MQDKKILPDASSLSAEGSETGTDNLRRGDPSSTNVMPVHEPDEEPADGEVVSSSDEKREQAWLDKVEMAESDKAAFQVALAGVRELIRGESLWDVAEDLAREQGATEAVLAAYREVLATELAPATAELLGQRFLLLAEEVGVAANTLTSDLLRILELLPTAAWALERIGLLLAEADRFSELYALYDRALSQCDDASARIELLWEAAQTAKSLGSDTRRAVSYLERLLALDPDDTQAVEWLEKLYAERDDRRKLLDLVENRMARSKGEERTRLLLRVAPLRLSLGQVGAALDATEQALSSGARHDEALRVLESLLHSRTRGAEAHAVRRRAAQLLMDHYQQAGPATELARVARALLALLQRPETSRASDSAKERTARLEQVATTLAKCNDRRGAFQALCQLLVESPATQRYQTKAAKLASGLEEERELAEALCRAANIATPQRGTELLLAAAKIFDERLSSTARATACYQQVSERSTDNAITVAALERLDALFLQQGRTKERFLVLERLGRLHPDQSQRLAMLRNAAALAKDQLKAPRQAARAWRQVLEEAPDDSQAIAGLLAALKQTGPSLELACMLEVRAKTLADGHEVERHKLQAAQLYEQFGDREHAIRLWQERRQAHGPTIETFEALRRLLREEQRHKELLRLLNEQLELVGPHALPDPAARVETLKDLARLRGQLGDIETALKTYVEIGCWDEARRLAARRAVNSPHAEACATLLFSLAREAWHEAAPRPTTAIARCAAWAARALADLLTVKGNKERAAACLLDAAQMPFDLSLRRRLRRDAALLLAECHGRHLDALRELKQLYEEDSSDPVARDSAERYALLLATNAEAEKAAALSEEQAELWHQEAHDDQTAIRLFQQAAHLWRSVANEERWYRCLESAGRLGDMAALEAIAEASQERGDHRAAVAALERLLERSAQGGDRRLVSGLVEGYLALGEREQAIAVLERAVLQTDDPLPCYEQLKSLHRRHQNWEALAKVLVRQVARVRAPTERARLLQELGELQLQLARPKQAVDALEQAIVAAPQDLALERALAFAYGLAGRAQHGIKLLERRLKHLGVQEPGEHSRTLLQLGRVFLHAGQPVRAFEALEAATEHEPEGEEALLELAQLAIELGNFPSAERALEQLGAVVEKRPEGVELRAQVHALRIELELQRVGEARAVTWLEQALTTALSDEQAAARMEAVFRKYASNRWLRQLLQERVVAGKTTSGRVQALATLVRERPGDPLERAWVREQAETLVTQLEAEQLFAEFGTSHRQTADAWRQLSEIYQWTGDVELRFRAEERQAQSLLLDDIRADDAEVLYRVAERYIGQTSQVTLGVDALRRAYYALPMPERAAPLLLSATSADPSNREALELLERVARTTGDKRTLAHTLSRLAASSDHPMPKLREAVATALGLDDRLLAQRTLEAALEPARSALSAGDAVWVYESLAALREEAGNVRSALRLLGQALQRSPQPRLELERARLLANTEQVTDAAAIVAELLRKDPTTADRISEFMQVLQSGSYLEEMLRLLRVRLDGVRFGDNDAEQAAILYQIAELEERLGRTQAAHSSYAEALDVDPAHLPSLRAMLRLQPEHAAPEAHAEDLERLIAAGSGEERSDAIRRLIALRWRHGPAPALARALELGLQLEPDNSSLRDQLIDTYIDQGKLTHALRVLESALAHQPGESRLVKKLAEVHRRSGRYEVALSTLEGATERDHPDLLFERYKVLADQGRSAEALENLRRAQRLDPAYLPHLIDALESATSELEDDDAKAAAVELSTLYADTDRFDAALTLLERVADKSRERDDVFRRIAEIAERAQNWSRAINAHRALVHRSDSEEMDTSVRQLIQVCRHAGRLDEALQDLESALKQTPSNRTLRACYRQLCEEVNDHARLARLAEDDAKSAPTNAERTNLLLSAAEHYLQAGDLARSQELVEQSREADERSVKAALLLAKVASQGGNTQGGIAFLEQFAQDRQHLAPREVVQLKTTMAHLYLQRDQLPEALTALSEAFRLDRRDASLAMLLGEVAMDLDQSELAERALRAVTSMNTEPTPTREVRLRACRLLYQLAVASGDRAKARSAAQKALSFDNHSQWARQLLATSPSDPGETNSVH